MDKAGGLLLDGADHCRMAMAQAIYADTGKEVEVGVALVVFDFHSLALNQHNRLAGKGVHDEMLVKLLCFFKTHGVPFVYKTGSAAIPRENLSVDSNYFAVSMHPPQRFYRFSLKREARIPNGRISSLENSASSS